MLKSPDGSFHSVSTAAREMEKFRGTCAKAIGISHVLILYAPLSYLMFCMSYFMSYFTLLVLSQAELLSKCAWLMEPLFEVCPNGLLPNSKMVTALKFELQAGRAFPYGSYSLLR